MLGDEEADVASFFRATRARPASNIGGLVQVWFLSTAPLHELDGEACVGWRWTTVPLLWYPYCPFQSRPDLCQHPEYTSIPLRA